MISSIFLVAIVIGSLVIIHEFGHLFSAKLLKIPVEIFSVGFGPVIVKRRFGSTEYRLSIIPLGGYIKLTGDEPDANIGFNTVPFIKKALVIISGPIANFILGIILTIILYSSFGVSIIEPKIIIDDANLTTYLQTGDEIIKINADTIKSWDDVEKHYQSNIGQKVILTLKRKEQLLRIEYLINSESIPFRPLVKPIIERVKKSSPADKIGIKKDDLILQIDTVPIYEWSQFVNLIQDINTKKHYLKWQRANRIFEDSITVLITQDDLSKTKIGTIGVWVKLPEKKLPILQSILTATKRSVYVAIQTVVILYKIIIGEISKSAIGGPVMVGKLTYEGAQWGIKYLLGLWAILSINLCVINLFPIPILDGGRVLLFAIESSIRKKFTKKQWEFAFYIGYALIAILLIFALSNDLTRLIKK